MTFIFKVQYTKSSLFETIRVNFFSKYLMKFNFTINKLFFLYSCSHRCSFFHGKFFATDVFDRDYLLLMPFTHFVCVCFIRIIVSRMDLNRLTENVLDYLNCIAGSIAVCAFRELRVNILFD